MLDKKKLISIVIPAINEESNIAFLLDEIFTVTKEMNDYQFEIIVVNDHSVDRTALIAKAKNIKVIDNHRKPGKGHALITGFENAIGEYFIMMDADCSHRAEDIPSLIRPLENGAGMVIGSRIYGGSDEFIRIREFGNIILTLLFGIFHKRYLSDALNGFKAFKSSIFKNYKYTSREFEIEIELLVNTLRSGMEIVEVPSHERKRKSGKAKSKVVRHGMKFLIQIVREWLHNKFLMKRK